MMPAEILAQDAVHFQEGDNNKGAIAAKRNHDTRREGCLSSLSRRWGVPNVRGHNSSRDKSSKVSKCRKVADVGEVVGLSKLVRACGLDMARLLAFVANTLI